MSKSSFNTYGEYRIKEVNGIRQFNGDGSPVLDEKTKSVRISTETAKLLNNNVANFGKVYILEEEVKKIEPIKAEVIEAKTETIIEVGKLEDVTLSELRQQAKEIGIKGFQIMKENKLIEKIKEASK